MKTLMIGLLAGTLLLSSISAFACDENPHHRGGQHSEFGHHQHHERMLNHLEKKLDLRPEQVSAIKEIYQQRKTQGKAFKQEDERRSRHYLLQLDPNASTYDADVAEAAEQHAAVARQKVLLMAETIAKIDEVLTPEQRDKMRSIRNQMKDRKKGRKAKHAKN
ncbi:MAG: hypothetical protein COA42_24080 [Alteromonadaceae bacterium]|nr:MAG: hypothetical protein COA42_24080 [Alteromonadaceae bacterium]